MSIPTDPDTRVLRSSTVSINGDTWTLEKWVWDGIEGNSAILELATDAKLLTDAYYVDLIRSNFNLPADTAFTVTRKPQYLFVNFFLPSERGYDINEDFDHLNGPPLTEEQKAARHQAMVDYARETNQAAVIDAKKKNQSK